MGDKQVVLYHWTTRERAQAILAEGFKDSEGAYGMSFEESGEPVALRGVWLSDLPLGHDQFGGFEQDTLLRVTLSVGEEAIAAHEPIEEGRKGYREWVLPAELVNRHGVVEIIDANEEPDP